MAYATRISFALPPAEREAVEAVAVRDDRTISQVVRLAVRQYVAHENAARNKTVITSETRSAPLD